MPHAASKKKDLRQNVKRRAANRARKSSVRTAMKRVEVAVEAGDADSVREAVTAAYKRIDKAAKTNTLHANTAARRKSLIARTAKAFLQ